VRRHGIARADSFDAAVLRSTRRVSKSPDEANCIAAAMAIGFNC
jgi:hypothetical protein